ncbi:MAG TPA: tetratricopeptide repeat protein [Rhizomicrobium sp.]
MRKLLLAVGAVAAAVAVTSPSFSMGGGGSGGGGDYSHPPTAMGNTSTSSDYTVAVRLIDHEKYSDAIPHLLMALADKPHDADILNYLGYSNRKLGQFPASLDYYKRALTYDPAHKGAHEYLGELYLQMHDLPSAQHELDTLASLCPSGCDERDTLTKAIAAYAPPASPATAPAATSAPATPTGG